MDKIDFSYMDFPDNSYGRVQGRRNEAWKLASRVIGKKPNEMSQNEMVQFYLQIVLKETGILYKSNNYLKMHHKPMRRRRYNKDER